MREILIIILLILFLLPHSFLNAETTTPIRHIIIIMQENHSFDNYFGTYPTGNGSITDSIAYKLQPINGLPSGLCLPYFGSCVKPFYANSSGTVSPYEGQLTYEEDIDNGRIDGFAMYSGPQSMAYFDYHQIPAYWDYAEEYALADNYFSTFIAPTLPNRLSLFSGDSIVSGDYGPPPYLDFKNTIFYQLSNSGVSWGYFEDVSGFGNADMVYPMNMISGMNLSVIHHIQDFSLLMEELKYGQGLPAVSFVSSIGSRGLDEHPPYNVTEGELWVVSIVNAVMNSPYWNSTAIFITWDEGGGYYDHVQPPQLIITDHGFDRPLLGYGQRVPLIVISPFAKENYVSETVLSHLSILHFIEYNWNLKPLNSNVANANLPLDLFYFKGSPRAPLILGSTGALSFSTYPVPLQIPLEDLPYDRSGALVSTPEQYLVPNFDIAVLALVFALIIFLVGLRSRQLRNRMSKSVSSTFLDSM